ncbi:deoxyfructose oxidoreductase [Paenibacillus sp. J31TS4]|uniref:Gfo/Idh/MocA family protein n=1 Tax=Paenibacillus sp. J31TS4 TaxID=2807195 RepID=UPI001B0F3E3A|nr:Gfo/Idh/MocA family oxidoreductase [Paenibacillus sp. J31TS4]GIP37728.1 deoxyfructose oxidoreductase [Paenibacillus sp. J31TS4]
MTTQRNRLRWGILGCARIAENAVIPGIAASETGEVAAIASRETTKAMEAAERHGIPAAYGSYEELLEDDTLDAVYIPLPNHLHKEWTIRAAQAGKHVLCEKPIALDSREAEEMVRACAEAGVLLAEAFMYRHHPRYDQILEIIRSGEIGEIRGIHGAFTFNSSGAHGNFRFRREWGGGSLYDIGVYPISAARHLLGTEPEAATVLAFHSAEHGDVDMMASGLLEFPGSVGLTFDCGMWAAGRNTLEVLGTEGRIEVPSAYVSPQSEASNFFVIGKSGRREVSVPQVNAYSVQADDFARAVWGDHPLKKEPEDAVRNMRALDACLRSSRERARVVIDNG